MLLIVDTKVLLVRKDEALLWEKVAPHQGKDDVRGKICHNCKKEPPLPPPTTTNKQENVSEFQHLKRVPFILCVSLHESVGVFKVGFIFLYCQVNEEKYEEDQNNLSSIQQLPPSN